MLKIVKLVIPTVLLICLIEGLPLLKKGLWKEIITLGLLLGIALFLAIGTSLGMQTPLELLHKLFSPLGKIIFKIH